MTLLVRRGARGKEEGGEKEKMLLLGRKIQCCWSGEELQGSGSVDEDKTLLVWRQAQQDECIDEAKMLVRREISR